MRTISDTLGQQVSAALEQQILAGMLAPGQRLNADELASEFGVSRIPVREALRSLNASGWIEIRPRHGAFVRRRSLRELEDLFHVRAMLEAEASRLAARNRTEAQLELIAQAHRDLVESNRRQDATATAEANSRFHRAVADASGNVVLGDLTDQLAKRIRWYFATVARTRGVHSAEEHSTILDAVRDGDARAAAKLTREHVTRTLSLVRDALRSELTEAEQAGA
jgi:DNA-binding GntR family transcriptional regulator